MNQPKLNSRPAPEKSPGTIAAGHWGEWSINNLDFISRGPAPAGPGLILGLFCWLKNIK
jgi:hypothetical protein